MCPSNGQKCASRSVEISNICESMNVSVRHRNSQKPRLTHGLDK